jgi:hypothetical protein
MLSGSRRRRGWPPKRAPLGPAQFVSLYDVLERARQKERVIEHQPKLAPTTLGDEGPEPAA